MMTGFQRVKHLPEVLKWRQGGKSAYEILVNFEWNGWQTLCDFHRIKYTMIQRRGSMN